jgi:ketosteroid isomerase-like protein
MRLLLFAVLSLTLAGCAAPPSESAESRLETLVAAEKAFAAMSETDGTRAAFLGNLADDGILFSPGPVNGRDLWEAQPEVESVLSWYPEIAVLSGDGTMGYTSGPFELRPAPGADPAGFGHFVSVWRRMEDGTWKVLIDGGNTHGPVPEDQERIVERTLLGPSDLSAPEGADPEAAKATLTQADDGYSSSVATRGVAEALRSYAAPDGRFLRNGSLPLVGRDEAMVAPSVLETRWSSWERHDAVVSDSGDLAFTYGTLGFESREGVEAGVQAASYYRIWKKGGTGDWQVAVDVLIEFPPA